jgi:hypothetical protein
MGELGGKSSQGAGAGLRRGRTVDGASKHRHAGAVKHVRSAGHSARARAGERSGFQVLLVPHVDRVDRSFDRSGMLRGVARGAFGSAESQHQGTPSRTVDAVLFEDRDRISVGEHRIGRRKRRPETILAKDGALEFAQAGPGLDPE